MQCDICGTEVQPHQKFCMECGARLDRQRPALGAGPGTPAALPAASSRPGHPMFDPTTGQLLATPADDPVVDRASESADEDPDATNVLPALGAPITTFAPPDPTPGAGLPWSTYLSQPPTPGTAVPPPPPTNDYPAWPGESIASGSYEGDQYYEPTRPIYADRSAVAPTYGPPVRADVDEPTGYLPATYSPWEADVDEAMPAPTRTFRVKPLLVLAVLAIAAAVVGMFLDVVTIDAPGVGNLDGAWKLNDFGTNLTVAGIVAALAMLGGALAWCGGYRWGAGLAGGAGAAFAGWVALPLGAAEVQLANADATGFAGRTRDLGYWSLVAAGGLGLVILLVSLLRAGDDRRAGLDPWVAALGAIATVVAVVGPLIPLDGADITDNWSSAPGTDLPTLFFLARFVNLGMLLVCGVFGFLLVRRYGLGLVVGGGVAYGWLTLTSAMQQTARPISPAVANPGDLDAYFRAVLAQDPSVEVPTPYIVTIAGVALIGFFALVAIAMALIDTD